MEELDKIVKIFDTSLDICDYQYFHQLLHNRTILFNQEIDETIIESVYLPLKDFENDAIQEPVTLILNSPGGSVTDGFFLADYLTKYSKPLNILVTGYAASMAAIILAAGGKNDNITRMCYPSTYGLIHDGYVSLSPAETKTAQDVISFNEKVDQQIKNFIIDNTNITKEDYDTHVRQQWFLTSEEMLKYNLIDKII